MNKTELVQSLAQQRQISKAKAVKSLDAIFSAVADALQRGEKVQIGTFGNFETRQRKARTGRNPRTGEPVEIPARRAVVFSAAKALREALVPAANDDNPARRPEEEDNVQPRVDDAASVEDAPAQAPGADAARASDEDGEDEPLGRREHARLPIQLKVEYESLEVFVTEYTRNISKGGVFIRCDQLLELGTEFVFQLHVPGFSESVNLRGQVAWVRTPEEADGSKRAGMGVKFVYRSEQERMLTEGTVGGMLRRHRKTR